MGRKKLSPEEKAERRRAYSRNYYARNKARIWANTLRWREKHFGDSAAYQRHLHSKNPETYRAAARRNRRPTHTSAHSKFQVAIRNGSLAKAPCRDCGNTKTQAHHEDYAKPLEVVWLCAKCHKKVHISKKITD